MSTSTLPPQIAALVLSTFSRLPQKSHPRPTEWTPLSATIFSSSFPTTSPTLTLISLATGTKCLPAPSLPLCTGTVLHDSHAEILALRGFNRWLLAEMEMLLSSKREYESKWLEYRPHSQDNEKPFLLRPHIDIHMFSTEAPCGDASMGLLIDETARMYGDAKAWPEPASAPSSILLSPSSPSPSTPAPVLHGRSFFSLLGLTRRKPSRADAVPTLSKSCTDKLTLKQATSILAWPASQFMQRTENAFLRSLVLPEAKVEAEGFERAFGRLDEAGEGVRRFEICTFPEESGGVDLTFPFSKPTPTPTHSSLDQSTTPLPPSKASNLSALYVASANPIPHSSAPLLNETLLNGVKQGAKQWGDQDFKMSGVCRRRIWEAGQRVARLLADSKGNTNTTLLEGVILARTYAEAKQGDADAERRGAKEDAVRVLGGWVRNEGDAEWGL
jgi:tRNA-specific adenosine deaminase 1